MNDKYDGGPAFPDPGRAQSEKQREKLIQTGMSLRDYFAAQAITGLLAKGFVPDTCAKFGTKNHDLYAEQAYIVADAMLKARDNG